MKIIFQSGSPSVLCNHYSPGSPHLLVVHLHLYHLLFAKKHFFFFWLGGMKLARREFRLKKNGWMRREIESPQRRKRGKRRKEKEAKDMLK